ncbi:MAG TPA: cell division protein FtsH, partial [Solirubrobacteraceae bacterium]|nr:cell division protein FtsH [Solirubrobacteraceae bacterium]
MSDDTKPSGPDPTSPDGQDFSRGSTNGAKAAAGAGKPRAAVRSGLAHRRNPVLATLGDFFSGARRVLLRDPISLFLLLASIGLAVAFFVLLGAIQPSSFGRQVPLSTVQTLAARREVGSALLLDHDNRVEL